MSFRCKNERILQAPEPYGKCEICELKSDIASAKKDAETSNEALDMMTNTAADWRLKAETAEAKIQSLERQWAEHKENS